MFRSILRREPCVTPSVSRGETLLMWLEAIRMMLIGRILDNILGRQSTPILGACVIAVKSEVSPALKARPYSTWDFISVSKTNELEEEQYFLCSGYIYGYILKERKWRRCQFKGHITV